MKIPNHKTQKPPKLIFINKQINNEYTKYKRLKEKQSLDLKQLCLVYVFTLIVREYMEKH